MKKPRGRPADSLLPDSAEDWEPVLREPPETPTDPDDRYLPLPTAQRQGIGLCLSGGGFRAALFHLGALQRLYELGVLLRLWTISSVSGGSIAAAFVATRLAWPRPAPASWENDVARPMREFTRRNARTPALASRLLPWNWLRSGAAVESLARSFERRLTSQDLSELPRFPIFLLGATDLTFGDNWVFQKDYMGAYRPGYVTPARGQWPVARAVAASTCFPPVFSPMKLHFSREQYVNGAIDGAERDAAIDNVFLADGGNYDNLALEPVWKHHSTVLVSDGGSVFRFGTGRGWLQRALRFTAIVENQSRGLRKRWLIASFKTNVMNGAYWGIGSARSRYDPADGLGYSKDLARNVISAIRTDLDAFSEAEAGVLENHGYLLADAAIRKHAASLMASPVAPLSIPHPEWMDESRVRRALAGSGKTRLLGRWS